MISLFSIEGNIAAGKSALLHKLKQLAAAQQIPLFIVSQPTEELQSSGWLERLYQDMDTHAFSFQMLMLNKQLRAIMDVYYQASQTPNAIIVTERSIHSVSSVFTAALVTLRHISSEQKAVITELSQSLLAVLRLLQIQERGYVYIQTPVEVCLRHHEQSSPLPCVSASYLHTLEAVHTMMLQSRALPFYSLSHGYTDEEVRQLLYWMLRLR